MKRTGIVLILLLTAVYFVSGFYVVRGNEKAVVRRFGKVLSTPTSKVLLIGSGLHFDLPWPLATVDRINLNEIRTLTIGVAETDNVAEGGFLQAVNTNSQSQFLTGDKNILNLQIRVQYRIDESRVYDYLFASESPERHLQLLAESTAADLISRSGVDFVHPLGLGELREMLTRHTRRLADQLALGVDVEEVTIDAVYPPVQVKAQFLDVSNARADKQKYINAAHAYTEQRLAAASAEEREVLDRGEIFHRQTVEASHGAAKSFVKVIDQFRSQGEPGSNAYIAAREMAMQRLYIDAMEDILRRVSGKVLLDSGKEVDITIFKNPNE